jgi:hypothetical protein
MIHMIQELFGQTLSPMVALFGAVATVLFAARNWKRELVTQRLNVAATELKYFEEFRRWADQLGDALTEAIHLCDLDPTKEYKGEPFFDRSHRLRITISSMIDRGRWFFPNIEVDDHGAQKELGYRGYRHELLDGIVSAYKSLGQLDCLNKQNNESLRDQLTMCKRHFVGQVQKILDPSRRFEFFDRIRWEVNKRDRE